MKRSLNRVTAGMLSLVFTASLLPVSLSAQTVTDTQATGNGGSQASVTGGVVPVNPNDPAHYPYGYYPTNRQYGLGGNQRTGIPTMIGAAFGGLLGANFGLVGTLAGAVAGGVVGNVVGRQLNEAPYGTYLDNYNNRLDQYYADQYSQMGNRQARMGMLPGIAGGVFGALIGASVGGSLGAVVGGIGGFLVGQIFARVLFPQQYYDNYLYGGNYPWDGFRNLPPQFQNPNQGNNPIYTIQPYPYPGAGSQMERFSGTGNLNALRQGFYKAVSDYEAALKSGTNEQKLKARQSFEAARDAYFSQKAK